MSLLMIIGPFQNGTVSPSVAVGIYASDDFNGSSLDSSWLVNDPGNTNIAVSGGALLTSGLRTAKDAAQHFSYTGGFHYSTLRQFRNTINFQLKALGANGYGAMVGVKSARVISGGYCSGWALVDFKNNLLQIVGAEEDGSLYTAASTALTVPIAINDNYVLYYEMNGITATCYCRNVTQGIEQSVTFTYHFLVSDFTPVKPNLSLHSFGILGSTQIAVTNFTGESTEQTNIKGLFVGDSITVRAFAGTSKGFAELLQDATSDRWQIMAGQGNIISDASLNLPEIQAVNPAYALICLGTNNGGNPAAFSDYQNLVTSLIASGTTCIPLAIPNGGDPATSGTFNYLLRTTYANFIDTWTTGWNIMAGLGEMADGVHPTAAGHIRLKNIIKAARPSLFPL